MATSNRENEMEKESILMFNALAALYATREEEARKISEHIIKLTKEHDALKSAAKEALDALVLLNGNAHLTMMSDDGPVGTYANKVFRKTCLGIESLRQAGVQ